MSAVAIEIPTTLSVTLAMDDELRKQLRASEGELALVTAYIVDCGAMAQIVSDERTSLAKRIDNLKAVKASFVAPAKQIIANAEALFDPALESLTASRELLGQRLLTWTNAEKARVAKENAEREEAARKARQEAEAKAAAERARADEIAAAARREAQAALQRRQQAEAEGNTRAAAAAAAEAAKAEEKANAAEENAEANAQQAYMQAAAVASVPLATVEKIAGTVIRDNWVAKLAQGETDDSAQLKVIVAAADRVDLRAYLKLDFSALSKSAKALKGHFQVPGFVAVNDQGIGGARR